MTSAAPRCELTLPAAEARMVMRHPAGHFSACIQSENMYMDQGASSAWDAPLDPTSSLVTPVWAPCKLCNIRFVTKIDGHFRPKPRYRAKITKR